MNNFQEWSHNSHQKVDDDQKLESPALGVPCDDAASNVISAGDPTLSPRVSPVSSLTPNGSSGKTIRRRPRASKKSHTTILSANPENFRSLVEKFTGCNSSSNLSGVRKGPITLDFAQYNNHSVTQQSSILHQHELPKADYYSFSIDNNCTMEPSAASTMMDPSLVADGKFADFIPEELTIDEDLEIMLKDMTEPGHYPDLYAGSSKTTGDFW